MRSTAAAARKPDRDPRATSVLVRPPDPEPTRLRASIRSVAGPCADHRGTPPDLFFCSGPCRLSVGFRRSRRLIECGGRTDRACSRGRCQRRLLAVTGEVGGASIDGAGGEDGAGRDWGGRIRRGDGEGRWVALRRMVRREHGGQVGGEGVGGAAAPPVGAIPAISGAAVVTGRDGPGRQGAFTSHAARANMRRSEGGGVRPSRDRGARGGAGGAPCRPARPPSPVGDGGRCGGRARAPGGARRQLPARAAALPD